MRERNLSQLDRPLIKHATGESGTVITTAPVSCLEDYGKIKISLYLPDSAALLRGWIPRIEGSIAMAATRKLGLTGSQPVRNIMRHVANSSGLDWR